MTLLFHLIAGLLDIFLLRRLARHPSPAELLAVSVRVGSVAMVVSWGLAELIGHSLFALFRLWGLLAFVHLPIVLIGSAWISRRSRRRAGALLVAAFALGVVAIDAYWIEPRWLEVSRVEIASDRLEEAIRIVVLADLQTDRIADYERRVLATVMDQEADLILLPGDYLQIFDAERRRVVEGELHRALREVAFGARFGAFALRGDMEGRGWQAPFVGTGVTALSERTRLEIGELVITALGASESHRSDLEVVAQPGFHLVVGHAPDFALGEIEADLLIAGHTHGGQIRLPWIGPLLTFSRVPRAWAAGVTDIGAGRTLIVSRGVGMERGQAPRVRFRCRPEIVVIDLVPQLVAPQHVPKPPSQAGQGAVDST